MYYSKRLQSGVCRTCRRQQAGNRGAGGLKKGRNRLKFRPFLSPRRRFNLYIFIGKTQTAIANEINGLHYIL